MRIELGETPLSENLPSISVIVPLVLPFTRTFTPMTGSPVWSTTVPVTVMFPVCFVTSNYHHATTGSQKGQNQTNSFN